jgi:hypothetical protein
MAGFASAVTELRLGAMSFTLAWRSKVAKKAVCTNSSALPGHQQL